MPTYPAYPIPYPAGFNQYSVNDRFMWGGNIQKMQWFPMPSSGLTANKTFDDSLIQLENGGAQSVRSAGYHLEYDLSWAVREAHEYAGLDSYGKYAAGYYTYYPVSGGGGGSNTELDTQYFYFANPMNFRSNLMAPQWASPTLSSQSSFSTYGGGFLPIGDIASWVGTATNGYDQPPNTVVFDTANAQSTDKSGYNGQNMVIPIPPTHSLWLGFSGSVTGVGAIGISYHDRSTGLITTLHATDLLDATESTRLDSALTLPGSAFDYAAIFITSTGDFYDPGTVSLTSSMAQLWPDGVTPDLTGGQDGNHIHGEGNTGMVFGDSAIADTYVQVINNENRHYKGMTTKLIEVEAWRL